MHVAASARAALEGVKVRVSDAALDMDAEQDVTRLLEETKPGIFGLSGLTNEEASLDRLAGLARSWDPGITIVAGGPIASSDPLGLLDRIPAIDMTVFGEGELTFIDIVRSVSSGTSTADLQGVASRDGSGRPRAGQPRPFVRDLDSLEPLDWSEMDLPAYGALYNFNDFPVMGGRYIPIQTSRGCPYSCTYCHGHFGKKVRARDPVKVVAEMAELARRFDVREFHISDDIFNHRKGRIEELCAQIRRSRLDVRFAFPNGLRGDRLTAAEIEALAGAGCHALSLAVETVTPRFQEMIGKRLKLPRVFRAAQWAEKQGILTRCFVMLGFPGETLEEMKATMQAVADSAFDIVHIFTVAPNPGTDLFLRAVEAGFDPHRWHGADYQYDKCCVNASGLPDEVFTRFIDRARLYPYSRPERRARLLAHYERSGMKGHPLFMHGAHWRLVLGEMLARDAKQPRKK